VVAVGQAGHCRADMLARGLHCTGSSSRAEQVSGAGTVGASNPPRVWCQTLTLHGKALQPALANVHHNSHCCFRNARRDGGAGTRCDGAGDGNRTRIASLEGWSSTIELHPLSAGVILEFQDIRIRSSRTRSPRGPPISGLFAPELHQKTCRDRSSAPSRCSSITSRNTARSRPKRELGSPVSSRDLFVLD
jgi:hypothetical protein